MRASGATPHAVPAWQVEKKEFLPFLVQVLPFEEIFACARERRGDNGASIVAM